MLLIDEILKLDEEKNFIMSSKDLRENDRVFQGHFPNCPLMPGVLIIEAMAQTAGVLILQKNPKKLALFTAIENAKFRQQVKPLDKIIFKARVENKRKKLFKVYAAAYVNEKLVAEATLNLWLEDN